ncbi:MAG: 3-hydroxyisobutyrate dehydrogenase [Pseudomonadota bacterium]
MARAAFLGLGNMGGPMAKNLAGSGYDVVAFDLSADARERAERENLKTVESAADAVAGADVIVSMLPAGKHVASAYADPGGIFDTASAGALLIDCSTIDVDTARDVIAAASDKDFDMVDAPVSGGVSAAEGGTLTFMVGGEPKAFELAKPVLSAMGKNIFHAGAAGNGQAAKIANNMLLGISMIGTCEAFNLAEKLGLDAQTFFDIASTASGQCWSMTSYCPAPGPVPAAPSNRSYTPGFAAAMMLKDLRLAQSAAQSVQAATPLGGQALSLYALMEAHGEDGLDFSGIMRLINGERNDA